LGGVQLPAHQGAAQRAKQGFGVRQRHLKPSNLHNFCTIHHVCLIFNHVMKGERRGYQHDIAERLRYNWEK